MPYCPWPPGDVSDIEQALGQSIPQAPFVSAWDHLNPHSIEWREGSPVWSYMCYINFQ